MRVATGKIRKSKGTRNNSKIAKEKIPKSTSTERDLRNFVIFEKSQILASAKLGTTSCHQTIAPHSLT